MLSVAAQCYELLPPEERRRVTLVVLLLVVAAFVEMIGIGAVVPFLSAVADPESAVADGPLAMLYDLLGFTDPTRFIVFLGVAAAVAILFSNGFLLLTSYVLLQTRARMVIFVSQRLIRLYSVQPYTFFLNRNAAELIKHVNGDAAAVGSDCYGALMRLFAKVTFIVVVTVFLVLYDPAVTGVTFVVLGSIYTYIAISTKRQVTVLGERARVAGLRRFRRSNELFNAIKPARLSGVTGLFLDDFEAATTDLQSSAARMAYLGERPRYLIEGFVFSTLLLAAVFLLSRGDDLAQLIPTVGLFALAGYRILPAMQQIMVAVTQFNYARPIFDTVFTELTTLPDSPDEVGPGRQDGLRGGPQDGAQDGPQDGPPRQIRLSQSLVLENVSFSYDRGGRRNLCGVSLTIPARKTVGVVGPTGAGKTTLIDVILGLLTPEEGRILVDGVALGPETLPLWQRSIGYVPQDIYLLDDTVARNIAFGLPADLIDMEAVERAARAAQIHDFVVGSLSAGYESVVGDRGIRLSGGQLQRIGIARALYHDPEVLVFDEATSALDIQTEAVLMEAVGRFSGEKTIIMIAHRTQTLADADLLIRLEEGRLVSVG